MYFELYKLHGKLSYFVTCYSLGSWFLVLVVLFVALLRLRVFVFYPPGQRRGGETCFMKVTMCHGDMQIFFT